MNCINFITLISVLVWGLLALTGCSGSDSLRIANELRFSLEEISSLTISYDEENIVFLKSDTNELLIKEYMTENNNRYYAKTQQSNNAIHISEGEKPLFGNGFTRRVEVHLPDLYKNKLTVTSSSGTVDFSDTELDLSSVRIDCTSGEVILNKAKAETVYISSTDGTLTLGDIEADQIKLETTGGNISCDKLSGSVTYVSTSGNLEVKSAAGSGSYRAENSGTVNVVYTEVKGDLFFFN